MYSTTSFVVLVSIFLVFTLPGGVLGSSTFPQLNPTPNQPESLKTESESAEEEVTIIFGGDVMLSRTIESPILNNNFNPFEQVISLFRDQDAVVVNLEYVAANSGTQTPGKFYTFRAKPKTLQVLVDAGITAVSVANNHAGDYGLIAFEEMLDNLSKYDIGYFGGGNSKDEAYSPLLIPVGKWDVAMIGVNMIEIPYFAATATKGGIAWLDNSKLKQAVKKAKQEADFVVVMPHWGWEYTAEVNDQQQQVAKLAIDAGADLIIGGHPHHIQPKEVYKGKEIYYSLGNLVFDGYGPPGWQDGELVRLTIADDGLSTEAIPYHVGIDGLVSLK